MTELQEDEKQAQIVAAKLFAALDCPEIEAMHNAIVTVAMMRVMIALQKGFYDHRFHDDVLEQDIKTLNRVWESFPAPPDPFHGGIQ